MTQKITREVALQVGQTLVGRKGTYQLLEALKSNTIFKARLLPESAIKSKYAVVKTELGPVRMGFHRERRTYTMPAIASSPHIRKLHDIIGTDEEAIQRATGPATGESFGMVFECMDQDLKAISSEQYRENSNLPKVIAKSVLSALSLLKMEYSAVHTDINPNNIFVSDLATPSPQVKVGDLGNVLPEGIIEKRVQSLETRAPEVWRGLGCWHPSDVWSLGVTLVHWLSPVTLFGPRDKIVQDHTEAWCIAKIRRLVGPLGPPPAKKIPEYEEEFELAEDLETKTFTHPITNMETPFIKVGTLREELEQLPGPRVSPDLLDFIDYLLVIDHEKRPTAMEALGHPYLNSS